MPPRRTTPKALPPKTGERAPAPVKKVTAIKTPASPPKETAPQYKSLLPLIEKILEDNKAQDVLMLSLGPRHSLADHMVIVSGTSKRHLSAMADHLHQILKKNGYLTRIAGQDATEWVVVDAGDVIIHLFTPEMRALYNLEHLWGVGAKERS